VVQPHKVIELLKEGSRDTDTISAMLYLKQCGVVLHKGTKRPSDLTSFAIPPILSSLLDLMPQTGV